MPLTNVNTSIRNVPMDYFLRGVDAVKPQGAPPAGQGPAEAEAVPTPEGHPAGRLVSQLDVLLMKAGPAREAYLDAIRPRLSDGCFRAAVSHLDDVIAHAEALERKGDVLEGDAWLDRAEQPLGTGDITVRKQDGGTKRLGGTIALNIHILSCPSYFARDLFDRLFD